MKKCAKCGHEYEDAYDGCPECAKPSAPKPSATSLGCAIIIVLVLFLSLLGSCTKGCGSGTGSSSDDNPALANKASSALSAAGGSAAIHDVTAFGSTVVVTLTLTTEAMGGKVNAQDAGQGVAGAVLASVPDAAEVMVYDADRSLIDLYKRR
jgi:hypothetical protein